MAPPIPAPTFAPVESSPDFGSGEVVGVAIDEEADALVEVDDAVNVETLAL